MYRRVWIRLSMVCVAVIAAFIVVSLVVSAQGQQDQQGQQGQPPPPVYNPYPPGILPSNVSSELERVRREVRFIENEAIAEWHKLGPVTYTGQPPIIKGNGYQ